MKVTSELPNCDKFFLRRMVGWCAKELDIQCKSIVSAEFDICKSIYSGRHQTRGSFKVSIGSDNSYPITNKKQVFADEIELLVWLSGWMVRGVAAKPKKQLCNAAAAWCLKEFSNNRAKLVFDWCKPEKIKEKAEPLSLIETRKKKVERALAGWEKKMKLAKTKVAKYRKKLAYYEKKILD